MTTPRNVLGLYTTGNRGISVQIFRLYIYAIGVSVRETIMSPNIAASLPSLRGPDKAAMAIHEQRSSSRPDRASLYYRTNIYFIAHAGHHCWHRRLSSEDSLDDASFPVDAGLEVVGKGAP